MAQLLITIWMRKHLEDFADEILYLAGPKITAGQSDQKKRCKKNTGKGLDRRHSPDPTQRHVIAIANGSIGHDAHIEGLKKIDPLNKPGRKDRPGDMITKRAHDNNNAGDPKCAKRHFAVSPDQPVKRT